MAPQRELNCLCCRKQPVHVLCIKENEDGIGGWYWRRHLFLRLLLEKPFVFHNLRSQFHYIRRLNPVSFQALKIFSAHSLEISGHGSSYGFRIMATHFHIFLFPGQVFGFTFLHLFLYSLMCQPRSLLFLGILF